MPFAREPLEVPVFLRLDSLKLNYKKLIDEKVRK